MYTVVYCKTIDNIITPISVNTLSLLPDNFTLNICHKDLCTDVIKYASVMDLNSLLAWKPSDTNITSVLRTMCALIETNINYSERIILSRVMCMMARDRFPCLCDIYGILGANKECNFDISELQNEIDIFTYSDAGNTVAGLYENIISGMKYYNHYRNTISSNTNMIPNYCKFSDNLIRNIDMYLGSANPFHHM